MIRSAVARRRSSRAFRLAELLVLGEEGVGLRSPPRSGEAAEGAEAVLAAPVDEVAAVQALAPQQGADRAWLGQRVRLLDDAQLVLRAEAPAGRALGDLRVGHGRRMAQPPARCQGFQHLRVILSPPSVWSAIHRREGVSPDSGREGRRPMRAIVCTDYGPPDVLRLRDVPKPVPKDDEVLVRIRATTVSAADCELRRFDFAPWIWLPMRLAFGIRRPRRPVLGQELAGDIESVGKDVRSFGKGDRVFAATGIGLGAYAEYICLRENPQTGAIATMPANLSYEEAAAVPYGGGEASQFLRKANVRSGQRVLVNGAGGSFGTFAVQLAKVLGAHVTAVDSAPKLEMLRAIGADRVIDYSQEDFTDGSETYDVIFDVVRGTPSGSHGEVADRERMPAHGQSGVLADRSRQVGGEGEQEAGVVRGIGANERGPGLPARPGRSGKAAPGHRPALPAGADGRGSPVRRDRAEVGEHRCHRCVVAAAIASLLGDRTAR